MQSDSVDSHGSTLTEALSLGQIKDDDEAQITQRVWISDNPTCGFCYPSRKVAFEVQESVSGNASRSLSIRETPAAV